jgi:TRAP-type C4-dicarboxylate transport system substrate-binding protein
MQQHVLPLFEEIEKATQGRVKVEVLPKVVGTALSQYDVVRDGLADMAYIIPSYTPGRFILAEMGELPGGGNDASVIGPAFNRIYRKYFAELNEFGDVKPLAIYSTAPVQTFNAKRAITAIEDFKGLKLRSPGPVATTALTLLGGVPILKSSAEVYEMLSTGAIDGQMTTPSTVVTGNTIKFTRYATIIPGGIANSVHMIGVNAQKWSRISSEDQKVIEELASERFARAVGESWQKQVAEAMETMKAAGYRVDLAGPDFIKAFGAIVRPIDEEWIKQAKERGVTDPAAILSEYRKATQDQP